MYLVNIIPIAKSAPQKELSYFSSEPIKPGAVVFSSLRKKRVPALVVSISKIKEKKSAIKQSSFVLRKIESAKTGFFLTPELIKTAQKTALFFASSLGSVLKSIIPAKIFELYEEVKPPAGGLTSNPTGGTTSNSYHQTISIQGSQKERFKYYKNLIREEFAKNKSVFVCLPTLAEIEKALAELKQGIENYTLMLHSNLTKKTLKQALQTLEISTHPLLIISTGLFLCLTSSRFGTIIMEHENSSYYKLKNRPFIDFRTYALFLSQTLKNRLVWGDLIPGVETFDKSSLNINHSLRVLTKAQSNLINLENKEFKIISPELEKILRKNQKTLLFINRRGYYPTTVCNDCQRTITCPNCSVPLVLHSGVRRSMLCHKCLSVLEPAGSCPFCQSWRLQSLGIGIQKTAEEIKKILPEIKLFRLDSDAAKTKNQGKEIVREFISQPKGVLLATELLFSYFNEESIFDNVAVVSVDNLLTIPDFKMNERLFRLLIILKKMAQKTFLIQTRLPEQKLFSFSVGGNISGFLKQELETRKKLQYPPFNLVIKISKQGKNNQKLKKEISSLASYLKEFSPVEFPGFIAKIKGKYRWNIVLKLKPEQWPNPRLSEALASLSPGWQVNVNPDNLL